MFYFYAKTLRVPSTHSLVASKGPEILEMKMSMVLNYADIVLAKAFSDWIKKFPKQISIE